MQDPKGPMTIFLLQSKVRNLQIRKTPVVIGTPEVIISFISQTATQVNQLIKCKIKDKGKSHLDANRGT